LYLFTFKQILARLIEQDDVISYGGAENGSCIGRWRFAPALDYVWSDCVANNF